MTQETPNPLADVLAALRPLNGLDDCDEASLRVARRRIAEHLGLPREQFRLIGEPPGLTQRYASGSPEDVLRDVLDTLVHTHGSYEKDRVAINQVKRQIAVHLNSTLAVLHPQHHECAECLCPYELDEGEVDNSQCGWCTAWKAAKPAANNPA